MKNQKAPAVVADAFKIIGRKDSDRLLPCASACSVL